MSGGSPDAEMTPGPVTTQTAVTSVACGPLVPWVTV